MTDEQLIKTLRENGKRLDVPATHDSEELVTTIINELCKYYSPAADAIESLEAKYRALHNEHCLMCGNYKTAHLGACDGCRWKKGAHE